MNICRCEAPTIFPVMNYNAAVGRGYDPQSWTFATGKIKLYASINMSPRYDNYIILYIYICLTCFSLTSISLITYWYILSGNPDLPTCILSCYRSGNSLTSPATYPYVSWISYLNIEINILSKYWNCVLHVFLPDKSVRPVMGLAPCHTEALQTRHFNGTPKAERCREPRFASLFVFSVPRNDERKTKKLPKLFQISWKFISNISR